MLGPAPNLWCHPTLWSDPVDAGIVTVSVPANAANLLQRIDISCDLS